MSLDGALARLMWVLEDVFSYEQTLLKDPHFQVPLLFLHRG